MLAGRTCQHNRRMIPAAIRADARYRIVDEDRIIDLLVLCGWAHEVQQGKRASAVQGAAAALDRWIAAGLPFAPTADGARRFDPVEVVNFLKDVGQRNGD